MNIVTLYLKNQIDDAYNTSFISTMDDFINAENIVNGILDSKYDNADYKYLFAYAQTAKDRFFDEINK